MRATIKPSRAIGTVAAPPSKSMAHRLLICAALSNGRSRISGVAFSQDIEATLRCLRALGVHFDVQGDTVTVDGGRLFCIDTLDAGESGSTLRFIIPIAAISGQRAKITASRKLLSRPLSVYEDIFSQRGMTFDLCPDALITEGALTSGEYTVPGDISSQFISGLLFALPLMQGDSIIRVTPPFESRTYVDLTIDAQRLFGIRIEKRDEYTFFIPGSQQYHPCDMPVTGDWSNAAALEGFSLIGGEVSLTGLDADSAQPDKVYRQIFERIKAGYAKADISECPDLAPVLFALAAAFHGAEFTGTKRLKYKESDRAAVMAEELAAFGAHVCIEENRVTVSGGIHAPDRALSSHNDHRIVMALCLLLSLVGGSIDGAQAVRKSFPDYFDVISAFGIKVVCDEVDQ